MADQDDDKLDAVLKHLDSIHSMCDSFKTRMDAMEEEHKKDRADAASWKARADAEEKEERERADREHLDKARADAATASAVQRDMSTASRKRLEEIEQLAPQFVDAQVRADAAYQALAMGQAPPSLYGENINDYKVRLLTPLKKHSKIYKDCNLGAVVADSVAFSVVEGAIVNDAVEASCAPPPVGAPLREQVTRADSGHVVRKFFGDPAVTWSPFMGGATQFGRINTNPGRR